MMPPSYQRLEDTERRRLEAKPRLSKWDASMLERVGAVLPLTWYLTSDRLEGSLGWQARQFVQWRFWVSKYDLQHYGAFPMDS